MADRAEAGAAGEPGPPALQPHVPSLNPAGLGAEAAVEIRNEFAAVDLRIDTGANAPRLFIRDLETGASRFVDAFVLRGLALAPPEVLRGLCRATVPTDEPPADRTRESRVQWPRRRRGRNRP